MQPGPFMIVHVLPIWSFLAVTVPLVLTPGASTAVVLRNSLSGGTRGGLETAVGANAGSVCYGLLTAFGFALALQRWPSIWAVLRTAGVLYLAWLGLQSVWRAITFARHGGAITVDRGDETAAPDRTALLNLREGFVTNIANPSLATFYLVILPQFIPRGAPFVQSALLLTAVHISLAVSWHAAWAAAGGTLSRSLASGRARIILELCAGVALLTLAAVLAFGRR